MLLRRKHYHNKSKKQEFENKLYEIPTFDQTKNHLSTSISSFKADVRFKRLNTFCTVDVTMKSWI